jgi:hypothetical protein
MTIKILGRLAGVATLTLALAGCIDMTMDLDVQSDTTAKSTVTTTMGKDFYPMVKAGQESKGAGSTTETADASSGFCDEPNAQLTENADGSATCVETSEGAFADLKLNEDGDGPTFTVVSPGVVRVAFNTAEMKGDLAASTSGEAAGGAPGDNADKEMDEQTKAMMAAFFTGHTLTMRIHGKEITDTNMELSGDKTTAEKVIPFLDLINGTADLPDELYAVVRTN